MLSMWYKVQELVRVWKIRFGCFFLNWSVIFSCFISIPIQVCVVYKWLMLISLRLVFLSFSKKSANFEKCSHWFGTMKVFYKFDTIHFKLCSYETKRKVGVWIHQLYIVNVVFFCCNKIFVYFRKNTRIPLFINWFFRFFVCACVVVSGDAFIMI